MTDEERQAVRSSWRLVEEAAPATDRNEYKRRRRRVLLESLEDVQAGRRKLSRRVINTWAYQRSETRRGRREDVEEA